LSFVAKSHEDVYKYALRCDRQERSLTDGFGLSIVLVNDRSPVCGEFLLKYFTELSHRTANRVRFIFFSELTASEAQRPRSYGPLQDLRPQGLNMVGDPEKMAAWLDQAAVPMIEGEALRFASRLGVGAHVPCLVVFTDVGDLHVHVMPIARLSADQVIERVRAWVNRFYADNRDALTRWERAEEQIKAVGSQVSGALEAIRTWRAATLAHGSEVKEIAAAIRACEMLRTTRSGIGFGAPGQLARHAHTPAIRELLDRCDKSIDRLESFQNVRQRAEELAKALRAAETADTMLTALRRVASTQALIGSDQDALLRSIQELDDQRSAMRSDDPEQQLDEWRKSVPIQPSYVDYDRCTAAWLVVGLDRRTRDEYSYLIDELRRLPVTVDPGEGTRHLFEKIGNRRFGADVERWLVASGPAQELVHRYLRELLAPAPEWFRRSPELTIGQALPREQSRTSGPGHDTLARERERYADSTRDAAERLLTDARAARDHCLVAIEKVMPIYETTAEHWQSTFERCLAILRDRRDAMERELHQSLETALTTLQPARQFDPEQLRDLRQVLDSYDEAVASLRRSYERDELLIRVPVETTLSEAAGLSRPPRQRPSQPVRDRLEASVADDDNAGATFDAAIAEAESLMPLAGLKHTLGATVSPGRHDELFENAAQGREILRRLTDTELARLHAHLRLPDRGSYRNREIETQEILAAVGADPIETRTKPSVAYEFDVFLSYHAPDRSEVERIAHALKQGGLNPWLDWWHLRPGVEFKPVIDGALQQCRACAVFVGPAGLGPWQTRELHTAYEAAKRGLLLVPVLLGGASVNALPWELRSRSCVEIASAADSDGIARLRWGLSQERATAA
jgi:uncharacterized protein YbbK (DUF523 family)